MDKEDIIKLAREAGFADSNGVVHAFYQLERFAALVAEHEREACAKLCDVLAVHPEYASDITKLAASAIRART